MHTIKPEFHRYSRVLPKTRENSSDSDTDAGTVGDFTLEMTQSPFADLMKKIEKLLDNGLEEDTLQALSLARTAIAEGIFDAGQELKLTEKLEQIIDILHAERELGCAFTKSTFGISALGPEEETHAFIAAPASYSVEQSPSLAYNQ